MARPMYNYFVMTTTQGDKAVYSTVYRAPLGDNSFSDSAEHYKGRGKWDKATRLDPQFPTSSHRLGNHGAKRFPGDAKDAVAYMRVVARRERSR